MSSGNEGQQLQPASDKERFDAAATELYACLRNTPCSCSTRWQDKRQVLVRECRRCAAVASWEALNVLPTTPRLSLVMPAAGARA